METIDIKIFGLKADPSIDKPDRLVIDIPSAGTGTATGSNGNTGTVYSSDSTITQTPVDFTISGSAKKALKGKVITLDAGHGGTDVGAIGHLNGKEYYEKDITLLSLSRWLKCFISRCQSHSYPKQPM